MEGQEFGAVLPQQANPIDTYRQIQQQNLEQKRYNDQRQTELTKYIVDKIDPHAYAIGDPVIDPIVNSIAQDTLQNTMKGIKSGVPFSDLLLGVSNATSKMNQYSQRAKAHDALVKHTYEELKKDPSIDADGYLKNAKYKFTRNPDGSMKTVEQMNPNDNYLDEIMRENPQLIRGSLALDHASIKKDNIPYERQFEDNVNGAKKVREFKGSYNPYIHDLVDANGNVTTYDKGNAVKVGVRNEKIPLKDGSYIPVVPKSVFDHNVSTPGAKYYLLNQAQDILKQHPELTEDQAVRSALFNHLNTNNTGYINEVKDKNDLSQIFRQQNAAQMQQNRFNQQENMKFLGAALKDKNTPVINDVYSELSKEAPNHKIGIPLNQLSATAQATLVKFANDVSHPDTKYGNKDIWVGKTPDGGFDIRDLNGNIITKLTPTDLNIPNQHSAKGKQEVIKQGQPIKKKVTDPATLKLLNSK